VTVHWYYTNELAAVTDNVQAEIELELFTPNANTGCSNSGIPLELQIKCIQLAPTLKETSNTSYKLKYFRYTRGANETQNYNETMNILQFKGAQLCV
jgi:hypothetical protein